jgi:uncharacterized protein
MESISILFLVLLFVIALLYSSVGHGGASGYLALMGLFHFAPEVMRPSALLLNVFVSLIAWWQYSRSVQLNKKLFLWLICGSIPAAFAGALITVDSHLYKQMLGVILLFQAARLFGLFRASQQNAKKPQMVPAIILGLAIGLLSGMIGIGGGIILSPLLLMLGWTDIKQTALISALFIFLNSLAGISGLLAQGLKFDSVLYIWIVVALAGGFLGSWLGSKRFSANTLKGLLAFILLFAGVKLIFLI